MTQQCVKTLRFSRRARTSRTFGLESSTSDLTRFMEFRTSGKAQQDLPYRIFLLSPISHPLSPLRPRGFFSRSRYERRGEQRVQEEISPLIFF